MRKIASVFLLAALFALAFCTLGSADGTAGGGGPEIAYCTVPMRATVSILYAVRAEGYDNPSALELLATKTGGVTDVVAPVGISKINGEDHVIFEYDNLYASDMETDVVACVRYDGGAPGGSVTYSVKRFVDDYVEKNPTSRYNDMLIKMLEYGESVAQMNAASAPTVNTYPINGSESWFRILDERQEATADYVTCDYTAAGIEFTASFTGGFTLRVNADNKLYSTTGQRGCYFRVYVDGKEQLNGDSPYYYVDGDSSITVEDVPKGEHTVKIVKATGYTLSRVDLISLTLHGSVKKTPPTGGELYLEFVGDAKAIGWGVVGNYDGDYDAQDGTLAYPYLIADKLGADCSIVGISGQGLLYGTPNLSLAYKYSSPLRSTEEEYSFDRRADLILIDVGMSDATHDYTVTEYRAALEKFTEYARAKNPDAHILFVCGMAYPTYNETTAEYVRSLGGKANKYYYYEVDPTAKVHTVHPTAEENAAYATELSEAIRQILAGVYDEEDYAYDDPTLTDGADVRIMSYNVLNPKWNTSAPIEGRDKIATDVIRYYMPDVVGVQETAELWHKAIKTYLVDTGYYATACAKTASGKYNMTTFLYNPKTVRLIDEYIIDLDEGSDIRVFAVAVFETISDGERFVVTNTHPAPASTQPENYARNFASILALVGEEMKKHEGLPIIMTGDFNTKEQADTYSEFMAAAGVKDAKYEAEILRRDYCTARPWGGEILAGNAACIDHLFVNDAARVLLYNVVIGHNVAAASDHIPIYADIAL